MAPDILTKLTNRTFESARRRIAKHRRTGMMEHNLYRKRYSALVAEIGIGDWGMKVSWKGKPINYALFVHFGTQPHFIHPRLKKALRWVREGNTKSRFAFAKAVRHPGYKGDPFLYDALDEAGRETTKIFERFIDGL